MTEHRHNPWKQPKRYRPRDRPVFKAIVKKQLEPTRAERKAATICHAEKYVKGQHLEENI